ncbi:hypothetical protein LMBIIBHN_00710 [Aeromonas salmonicida]
MGHGLGDVAELITRLEQHFVAQILAGETLKQAHQIVHLLDHEAGAGQQQHDEDDAHHGGFHHAAPEQAIGNGVCLVRVYALTQQCGFQIAGIEPELGQQQHSTEHHEQYHFGYQPDIAHSPLQRV